MTNPGPFQYIRSVIFTVVAFAGMAVYGIAFFPAAVFSRRAARHACRSYAHFACWLARWMVGIRTEVRGTPPSGEVLIAAKHQSFLDIIMIFASLPAAKFIMKKELMWAPFIGQYTLRIGCVPVDRGKRGKAIAKMLADVEAGSAEPGQLVIYPQGTRVAPGVPERYKTGAAALYAQTGYACVPVATNAGLFWPRNGILRRPGLAVVEFLPEIPQGLRQKDFLARLEREVETASDKLMAEAGFHAPDRH